MRTLLFILVPAFLLSTTYLNAEDGPVQKASTLAKIWKRTKSLVEPKEEIRRTKGMKGAELEIVEVKVDSDTGMSFRNIQFALDSSELEMTQTTRQQLAEIAVAMKQAGDEKFLIEGHTCDLGTTPHNKVLSQQRALSVTSELVRLGVDRNRVQALGFGDEQPLVANLSEEQRTKNRRVQIFRKL